jgi:CRP-like cAMP-binding protein
VYASQVTYLGYGEMIGEMTLLTQRASALELRAGKDGVTLLTIQRLDFRKV